jgi:hypothetical protein
MAGQIHLKTETPAVDLAKTVQGSDSSGPVRPPALDRNPRYSLKAQRGAPPREPSDLSSCSSPSNGRSYPHPSQVPLHRAISVSNTGSHAGRTTPLGRKCCGLGITRIACPTFSRDSEPACSRLSLRRSPISCAEAGAWKDSYYVPRTPRRVPADQA